MSTKLSNKAEDVKTRVASARAPWDEGHTAAAISRRLGVTQACVAWWKKRKGWPEQTSQARDSARSAAE